MINCDYKKSEDIAKESLEGVFSITDKITMQVQETQDEFIFRTLQDFASDNFQISIEKDELIKAIQLIRMYRENGTSICESWTTATQNQLHLNNAYMRGFDDGVKKEHDRIMDILKEREEGLDD